MPDLTTLLAQALASMEDLLDRQTILIDQMQDFFTFANTETIGTGDGATTLFAGSITYIPITPSTVEIVTVSGGVEQVVTDDGAGNLTGDGTGTVNYLTGAFSVTFTVAPDTAEPIYFKRPKVPFLKPDNSTVFIQSWLETVSQMEEFQATALGDMAPLVGGTAQTAEFPLARPVIYVDANNGDDTWDGSQPFPNTGSAGPFATLAKAVSVARTGNRLTTIELRSGVVGTPQTYAMSDTIGAGNAHLIIRGSDNVIPDSIDNTIIDFTGFDLTGNPDGGAISVESGKLNLSWLSLKSPHYLDTGDKYCSPIVTVLFGGHLEAFRCKFFPGDDVDTHTIGANNFSRALIYNFGGSLSFTNCTLDGDAPAGPTNVNGVFTRQSGSVHFAFSTVQNCAVGVGDQEGRRPGGFFTKQTLTFSSNLTDYDFSSITGQVANTNF